MNTTQTLSEIGGLPTIDGVPVYPSSAYRPNYGISHSGDVLVSRLRDGTDLNEVWDEIVEALAEFNRNRLSIVNLLSYPTTNAADAVAQNLSVPSFEIATEYGVPKIRSDSR